MGVSGRLEFGFLVLYYMVMWDIGISVACLWGYLTYIGVSVYIGDSYVDFCGFLELNIY